MIIPAKISIIVTTYNRPEVLKLVLQALAVQADSNFEVLVADDGSSDQTKDLITKMHKKVNYELIHVWQEDQGFRAAKIRNMAIAKASGDYIVFLDGDCVVRASFIANHRKLAEFGFFVAGNRVLVSNSFTEKILSGHIKIYNWNIFNLLLARFRGSCNRLISFISLPLGFLRKLAKRNWQGVKTCNLGVWKQDIIAVNGLEEQYRGWGYEDSDLVIRLLRHGILRKSGRFATAALHLWHQENDRANTLENYRKLQHVLESNKIKSKLGLDQYL